MEYHIEVTSMLHWTLDHDRGTSTVRECEVSLGSSIPVDKSHLVADDGDFSATGVKAITQGLVQGLVTNIHSAHKVGIRDSAEHLRYVIKELERGFVLSGTEVIGYEKKNSKARKRFRK